MNENYLSPENSVLGDLGAENVLPVRKRVRLANFLLDLIVLAFVGNMINGLLVMIGLYNATSYPVYTPGGDLGEFYASYMPMFYAMMLRGTIINIAYYTLTEWLLKGQTIGKLITGTQAVNNRDFAPVNFTQALVRSLCRHIPLEFIFCLFMQPWHDTISGTLVIKKKK
ncbi:hypothetical protein DCC81_10505 [Chitinophaga parva]|uniref:RDD domain-containing protein n=1 Tax=Chitinophaga parva TaxID=2169414 RepID=A0A2T7BEV7_9BACT|nr:RDD family protein [Chitinophaga parva]PUZ24763.1 hypothetical protein DCC81_10505 [Chitinophaga parva]